MRIIFTCLLLISLACSCVQTKNISKRNVFYKFDMVAGANQLNRYEVLEGIEGSVTDQGGYLVVSPNVAGVISNAGFTPSVSMTRIPIPGPVTGRDALIQASGDYFFQKNKYDTNVSKRDKFVYQDSRIMLQSLSIPLKIRPAIKDAAFNGKFPSQVETGFNFGFAAGWKFNQNVYRTVPTILGVTLNKFSLAPGILLNFGATTLNDKNTFPAFSAERKAFSYSTGVVLMFGFNNINFGIARARDYVTGKGRRDWVYQNKPWTGIIVALDLLK